MNRATRYKVAARTHNTTHCGFVIWSGLTKTHTKISYGDKYEQSEKIQL